ncbi:hypothetical protein [Larkinella sp.]|uniref:hypothetical protein n=1 Tax=Larkinella sp. TaxID=2034517 RepID=UPI003BAC8A45
MKASILGLFFCAIGLLSSFSQTSQVTSSTTTPTKAGQEIIDLSKQKWQWMADKNVDKLYAGGHGSGQ